MASRHALHRLFEVFGDLYTWMHSVSRFRHRRPDRSLPHFLLSLKFRVSKNKAQIPVIDVMTNLLYASQASSARSVDCGGNDSVVLAIAGHSASVALLVVNYEVHAWLLAIAD